MITKRFSEPRGIEQDTPYYGFYVRVYGESRELLKCVQQKASERMGGQPSNVILLDEVMRHYLNEKVS